MIELIKKTEIPQEPKFDALLKEFTAVLNCLNSDKNENLTHHPEDIFECFFLDKEKNTLTKITKEEEIILAIKTLNLAGKEIIIEFMEDGLFIYNNQNISKNDVLKVKLESDYTEVNLQLNF